MDGWPYGLMDGRMDGWTDGWMDGLMDEWTDGWMVEPSHLPLKLITENPQQTDIFATVILSFPPSEGIYNKSVT